MDACNDRNLRSTVSAAIGNTTSARTVRGRTDTSSNRYGRMVDFRDYRQTNDVCRPYGTHAHRYCAKDGPSHTQLLSPTVPAAKIRKLWPAGRRTAAAETRCQAYLVAEMQRSPERAPKPKAAILADCQARFPGLSERGFDRVWAHAIVETDAHWSRGGRPRH